MTKEGVRTVGDLQLILYRKLLVENGLPFLVTKHSVFLIYDICGSSEHCKPLLASMFVLFHLS